MGQDLAHTHTHICTVLHTASLAAWCVIRPRRGGGSLAHAAQVLEGGHVKNALMGCSPHPPQRTYREARSTYDVTIRLASGLYGMCGPVPLKACPTKDSPTMFRPTPPRRPASTEVLPTNTQICPTLLGAHTWKPCPPLLGARTWKPCPFDAFPGSPRFS